jgi:hypothetical protein
VLLDEDDGCFSSKELVNWLLANIDALERSWDKAQDAATVFTEDEGLLSVKER